MPMTPEPTLCMYTQSVGVQFSVSIARQSKRQVPWLAHYYWDESIQQRSRVLDPPLSIEHDGASSTLYRAVDEDSNMPKPCILLNRWESSAQPRSLGNQKGKLQGLYTIEMRIAVGIVAVTKSRFRHITKSTDTFRHILASRFQMHSTWMRSHFIVNIKESTNSSRRNCQSHTSLESICHLACVAITGSETQRTTLLPSCWTSRMRPASAPMQTIMVIRPGIL